MRKSKENSKEKERKKRKANKKRASKEKEKKNAFTWLQACFLWDVGVIWCNSLGDSHFQTYVIDNVEIVLNFYLHITLYVSHTLTSCTHHTQIFVNHCTCDCVLIIVAIQYCASWNVYTFWGMGIIFEEKMFES